MLIRKGKRKSYWAWSQFAIPVTSVLTCHTLIPSTIIQLLYSIIYPNKTYVRLLQPTSRGNSQVTWSRETHAVLRTRPC